MCGAGSHELIIPLIRIGFGVSSREFKITMDSARWRFLPHVKVQALATT